LGRERRERPPIISRERELRRRNCGAGGGRLHPSLLPAMFFDLYGGFCFPLVSSRGDFVS